MLRMCMLMAFMLLAATGIGIAGAISNPPTRKEDRVDILTEKVDEEDESEVVKELFKY